MANISHKTLTGDQLHEPKGVDAANAGEVYVADGAGSGAWAVPSASGLSLVEVESFSGAGTVDFTSIDDTYDDYILKIYLTCSASGTIISLRIGTGGGPTYQTSGYTYRATYHNTAEGTVVRSDSSAAEIRMVSDVTAVNSRLSNVAGKAFYATVNFSNPEVANFPGVDFAGHYNRAFATENFTSFTGGGSYDTATAITGIRILPDSGTITGTARLYGFRKTV